MPNFRLGKPSFERWGAPRAVIPPPHCTVRNVITQQYQQMLRRLYPARLWSFLRHCLALVDIWQQTPWRLHQALDHGSPQAFASEVPWHFEYGDTLRVVSIWQQTLWPAHPRMALVTLLSCIVQHLAAAGLALAPDPRRPHAHGGSQRALGPRMPCAPHTPIQPQPGRAWVPLHHDSVSAHIQAGRHSSRMRQRRPTHVIRATVAAGIRVGCSPTGAPARQACRHGATLRPTAPHCAPRRHTAPHGATLRPTMPHCAPRRETAPHGATLRPARLHVRDEAR
jgi:hypothetical protein